ncbi:MAG: hypothetical protein FD163_2419 [Hyphomonadaceae bacterium]|nr:MAG: hypothetical protein FD128_235 [Hyphomonadaceae bacterium]KAF0183302.1 MAG: hypothetical protein FD163_2419 [Hyphomonadaceae bacterium]
MHASLLLGYKIFYAPYRKRRGENNGRFEMKLDTKTKIILIHVGALIGFYIACFVWSKSHTYDGYDVFAWAFFNAIFVAVDSLFVILVSFSKKLEKGTKYAHWVGLGLALLLSLPTCFGFIYLLDWSA